jgi:octaprenyl-diphosphate synthase
MTMNQAKIRKVPIDPVALGRFKKTFELINTHLYSVEERIRAQARAFDPAMEGYVGYVCNSSGKRLRPALALLAGGSTGKITSSHVDLAVIIELIHIATLVHDDIWMARICAGSNRRSMPSGAMRSACCSATRCSRTP